MFLKSDLSEARKLKRFLSTYKIAFGQEINYHKLELSFSPNAPGDLTFNIKDIFGIPIVSRRSQYLGISSSIYHNSLDIFAPIVSCNANQVKDWKEKLFSLTGKIVLIKLLFKLSPHIP